MRVIDALQLPEVQDGSRWIALPVVGLDGKPTNLFFPGQTIGIDPRRGKMYWCDGYHDPRAILPTHFGTEAALTLPQLLGGCALRDAGDRGPLETSPGSRIKT